MIISQKMGSWADHNIRTCMKNVSAALALDNQDNAKDAYEQYLVCIVFAAQTLLKDAARDEVNITAKTYQIVKLLHQCMDRADAILQLLPKKTVDDVCKRESRSSWTLDDLPSVPSKLPLPVSPAEDHAKPTTLQLPSPRAVNSRYGDSSLTTTHNLRRNDKGKLSGPLAMAARQNQQLMAAYHARMSQMRQRGNHSATDLGLNLQRRMAENMALAKAREEALQKKLKERHKRLEAEAARRFSSSVGMSKDEQERRELYTHVLVYEQDSPVLVSYRKKLKSDPENLQLIQDLIRYVLSLKNHPLTELLYRYQYAVYNKIHPLLDTSHAPHSLKASRSHPESNCSGASVPQSPDVVSPSYDVNNFDDLFEEGGNETIPAPEDRESGSHSITEAADEAVEVSEKDTCESPGSVSTSPAVTDSHSITRIDESEKEALLRHFQNIVLDIRVYMEKMQAFFIVGYAELDNGAGKDMCCACVEELFFTPIWPYLLALARCVNAEHEQSLEQVMKEKRNCLPSELKINDKFCLDSSSSLPYSAAIDEVVEMTHCTVPLTKLEFIVKISRLVCKCVEDYYSDKGEEVPGIGADDLLPILVFVIIKAQLPQLLSECYVLEELVHEGYLMGEEGYCLTSLQTAIKFINSLSNEQ